MGSTNNGGQVLTFDYKQEGKSEGFNKIMYKLLSRGIIHGGKLTRVTDASITISPMLCFFEDTTKEVGIRLETTTNATVAVSQATPYIVGSFTWLNIDFNFMDFKAVITPEANDIIFGRCVFDSSGSISGFDYSRKSWAKTHYEKTLDYSPSFKVIANEPYDNAVTVEKGSAFVGGKKVEYTTSKRSPDFDVNVTQGRKDLLVLNSDGNLEIVKGIDSNDPTAPALPPNKLTLAIITFPSNPEKVKGHFIEYIYNSHYVGNQVTKESIGLGSVPNVSTNDQTPTYTEGNYENLISGEKLSIAFGKLKKAVSTLISHTNNKSNPHTVTATQVGLGNVTNLAASGYFTALTNSGNDLSMTIGGTTKTITPAYASNAGTIQNIGISTAQTITQPALVPIAECKFEENQGYIKLANGFLIQLMTIQTTSNPSIKQTLLVGYTLFYTLLHTLNNIEFNNKIIVQSRIDTLKSFFIEVAHVNENIYFSKEVKVVSIGI